jgi:hypothetical protein
MSEASSHDQQGAFPVVIYNPPGLSAISYRVGDYNSFRESLLQSLSGEVELKGWQPTDGDLALQLLEWWAYLADILTFYNERIANNSYIGTSVLPANAQPQTGSSAANGGAPGLPDNTTLIAQATGFKSMPGIAATGQLGVLVNSNTSISLPPSFAVQSKPGPGQQPQVFEAVASSDQYLPTNSGGAVPVDVFSPTYFTQNGVTTDATPGASASAQGPLLSGTITSVKPGDFVVVASISAPLANASSVATTVQSVATETDPRGRANTRLNFQSFNPPSSFLPVNNSPDVTQFQVLRSIQSTPTYSLSGSPAVSGLTPGASPTGVHLASLVRDIGVGDLVVMEVVTAANPPPSGSINYITSAVSAYEETIWYANADDPVNNPQKPPHNSLGHHPTKVAIPVLHTFLTLEASALDEVSPPTQTVARVWYGYRRVSALLDEMPASIPAASSITDYIVEPAGAVNTSAQKGATVLLEGTDGLGAVATLVEPLTPVDPIKLVSSDNASILALPLRLLFNVINVTAGKTVINEVLGSGDATLASQSFTLQKSPLTYLKGTNPSFPTSTLQVRVDNVTWTEAPDFEGQPPDAKIYVTQRDTNQNTTVIFGDGVNGARLTTGAGNVTATYRYGSGPGDPSLGGPAPGTLVTVITPYPGLGSIRNPAPMTGGAAPSTPAQVQESAANSVVTFGRAISPSDYEVIASKAPIVTRARAQTAWDPLRHSNVLMVYVSGGPDAVAEAQAALTTSTDPNVPFVVSQATEVDLQLAFNVTYDSTVDPTLVQNEVIAALTDPVTGLFAPSQSPIGEPLYDSQIYAACSGVAGVLAVRALTISNITHLTSSEFSNAPVLSGVVHSPGPGAFFTLAPSAVNVALEVGDG